MNYCYLNTGLTINYNSNKFFSNNGLLDLLKDNIDSDTLYPIIHLKGNDIEVAITHIKNKYTEQYFSFVNGQHTIQGGTHQNSFRQAIVKTIREFFGKNYDANDIRQSISAAVSIKVMDPVFESQTKTKLGSTEIEPNGITISSFINDFIKSYLDNFLHKNSETAKSIQSKILQAESERKAMSGIKKLAKERAKKASIHNKKLRDCRVHYNDLNKEERLDSTIFITELTKKIVYENEEFNLLQSALNIENGIDELRYNKIVIATDADVDGMHIRLLILTFFLQFFSDLVKNGHVFILQTPLFRVRNKKTTIYCYSEQEKQNAIEKIGKNFEITRFKGLGEISPNEFKNFIGKDMRLDPVIINKETSIDDVLKYYMGKNTSDRQEFIINNLKMEESLN